MWSCLCDKNSCDICKSFEGLSFIPGLENALLPPHPSCNASEGCRCAIVYVMNEELGAPEIADFIRRNGGKATDGELSKYR